MLELRELVKRYEVDESEPITAINGVSLSIPAGEVLALYGPSGSGKTTLLLLAAAILQPDSGSVFLDKREISALSRSEAAEYRMQDLGFIRQSLDLIPRASALDNAALKLLGRSCGIREAKRRVEPLLSQLGLGDRLSQPAEHLSMGERQRVMIARALSTDPKLLLADEPTGSLDSERTKEVLAFVRELSRERGVAVLLVTHDPEAAAFADRVCTLRDGTIVQESPTLASSSVP
ncbi:MAG: ABC transporter ATP-binding protein [Solirubrobacteraceae bacterium]